MKDIPNVTVESFSGLLVDYAKEKDVHVVIRGLRAITDFEYELQTAQTNAKLSNGAVDTVFLTTGLEYAYLSSSRVKGNCQLRRRYFHVCTGLFREADL